METNSKNRSKTIEPDLPFEERLSKLQQIVTQLETGQLSLQESLQLYQLGLNLSQSCRQELEQIQNEITVLNTDGQIKAYELKG